MQILPKNGWSENRCFVIELGNGLQPTARKSATSAVMKCTLSAGSMGSACVSNVKRFVNVIKRCGGWNETNACSKDRWQGS